jgi:hypothetical protein
MSEKITHPSVHSLGGRVGRTISPTPPHELAEPLHTGAPEHSPLLPRSLGTTERAATRHAARPRLQRLWGMPAPLHEAYRDANKAGRPIYTLIGTHALADEAIALAAAHPDHSIFGMRSESFAEDLNVSAGHLITYRGHWYAALEGLRPQADRFGLMDSIVLFPDFAARRTVAPIQLLRSLLAQTGKLNALVKTHEDAKHLVREFSEAFTPEHNEVVHIFGFVYFDNEMMLSINPKTGEYQAIDSMDIQNLGVAHFEKAQPGGESPFYWVQATRMSHRP